MTMNETLSVKALNQYRKRDILPYLGLRYYLHSRSGRSNHWIQTVCTRLALDSQGTPYLKTHHFKSFDGKNFEHRDIYLPSPSETLAEVALITEISKHKAGGCRS